MLEQLSVLVLEDHPFQRAALHAVLKQLNVGEILEAVDGYEALRVIDERRKPVDIVLCDLRMEGMDGVEFIRHVKQRDLALGVVLTSGLETELVRSVETMARSQGVAVLGRLEKPITAASLAPILERYASSGVPEDDQRFDTGEAQRSVAEVRRALSEERFIPYFQPKIRLSDRKVIGVEALARWRHPKDGLVGPGAFIPVMEKFDLSDGLTLLMLRQSLEAMVTWRKKGLDLTVSVNVSPASLLDTELPVKVKALLDRFDIPPDLLVLEITESAVVDNLATSLETMTRLRMYGIGLSIDDFGTGYSSMQQLSRIPFTELKIDRSFVENLNDNAKHRSIVSSTIRLAHDLNMKCVAEGAETEAEVATLEGLGCEVIQGFYFARPMAGEALVDWLAAQER